MNQVSCDAQQSASALKSIEEALALLLQQAKTVDGIENVPLSSALGRVLAKPVKSLINVPPWNNSAMDGFAVRHADLKNSESCLTISQRIAAGSTGTKLEAGTAARIFTGAPVPPGADSVVIQEVCHQEGESVVIKQIPPLGANIREAGEDIKVGEEILSPGVRLMPQHLGLAASTGVSKLSVYRRMKVAVFSSGDELVMPGDQLGPGQIYNSNQYTLTGLLELLGCEVAKLGIVEDSLEATCEALSRGAEQADLVLASGGVSVGEEDHVKPAVEQLGSLDLWKIAIRPGKPLAYGRIGDTPFIGTPGNPVSLFVTFCLFARPFILKSQGMTAPLLPKPMIVKADFDWEKPVKRREYARARLANNEQGEAWASLFPSRSSGVLSSVAWADGLAIIPEGQMLHRGDRLEFIPYCELI